LKFTPSLARQNTVLLAAAFIVMELLVIGVFALWVLLPLGRRSADDLAGLMVLSAQTWSELPPQTRPAFEVELLRSHALALRAEAPLAGSDDWHPPYFFLLEEALKRRTSLAQHLAAETLDTGTWYWAQVPAGGTQLTVGVAATRTDSQPVMAFFTALGLGLLMAVGVAIWLARRLTEPLARLEAASALIGQGGNPTLLPETGPREVLALSRRFNAMAQQVRELLSARTTLLAGVSHDLRTPLARMRLALEMLKDMPDPSLIERMEHDIEQMNRLIGNVLDLARGLAHEAPVRTDMVAFLNQLAADFSTPNNPILVTCAPSQWPVAPTALHRAIGNLLQNAQRYAPDRPVELVARFEPERCRIGVLDRGPGIAPDQLEAVFQPFYRLDASRSPVTGGSGLGLAIVRELARANGWPVTLEARPGGGLQAWLDLPAKAADGASATGNSLQKT
jgi:two-component system osmolarity sensor histidine kinase EnvZ